MKGISRRARACAAVAVTGAAVLATAGAAQAQRPASAGDGAPTGQGGVQMFNYGSYISTGGNTGSANPITNVAPASDGTQCATSNAQTDPAARLTECRWNRLEALFALLERKGTTNIELFGHAAFPANNDIAGLERYRALLDKYHLHAAGWHGDMSEANWDARVNAARILGSDSIGSGGFPSPGIGSYDNTLRTVEALNRLGKRAIQGGVGPVYFHNHTDEFDFKYNDNGVTKTAWQIVVDRMDSRYAFAEVDAFWASDAHNDVTGQAVAGLLNNNPTKIKMLHIKDGINVAANGNNGSSRSGSPRAFGTGEVDYRPIFAAAANRVEYYHQEHDGGTITDADISLTNMKGVNTQVKPAVLGLPTTFDSVPAGTPAAANQKAITITNKGDAPLTITAAALQTGNNAQADEAPGDFSIISNTCVGATVVKFGTCVVNVGFKPTVTNKTSTARLRLTSNADDATETFLLVGKSTGEALGGLGGDVPSVLSLTLGNPASFGSFVPAVARNYDTALSASIVSTAGNAALSVTDAGATAPGHLVNGSFSLPQPLQVRANNAANTGTAFTPLSETAGAATSLLSYAGPTAGADPVTINFRQAIGATDVLRAGSYSKTLTFTVSTTTP
jgi:sugar phosphate isomerase/epimerase